MEKKEEMMKKAYEIGANNEREYGACSQAVLAAVMETVGGISEDVYKSSTLLSAGTVLGTGTCGAVAGAMMAISCYVGRDYSDRANAEAITSAMAASQNVIGKIMKEYGGLTCCDVLKSVIGRSFDWSKPEDYEAYMAAGGHDDKCPNVCGTIASWTVESLFDQGLVK